MRWNNINGDEILDKEEDSDYSRNRFIFNN